jgi:hypothetical protein
MKHLLLLAASLAVLTSSAFAQGPAPASTFTVPLPDLNISLSRGMSFAQIVAALETDTLTDAGLMDDGAHRWKLIVQWTDSTWYVLFVALRDDRLTSVVVQSLAVPALTAWFNTVVPTLPAGAQYRELDADEACDVGRQWTLRGLTVTACQSHIPDGSPQLACRFQYN